MRTDTRVASAAVSILCAGAACAQPVVDGTLVGDESFYGNVPIWVQNQPTSFGDNHPSNVPPPGNPADVTTGIELAIPLSALGGVSGAGDVRLCGWVNSGDRTFLSNQVIDSVENVGNLGNPPIDFGTLSGQQWITINAAAVGTAPVVDGTRDVAIYGSPLMLQKNFTGFGDNQTATPVGGGGSEIDAVYAVTNNGMLYLFIAGNLEANGNGLDLFFDADTASSGQTTLSGSNPPVNSNKLNNMANITFDAGFEADFYVTVEGQGATGVIDAWYADLVGAAGFFLGSGTYASFGGFLGGGDPGAPQVFATIDNSNTQGVTGSPSVQIPSRDFAVGSELDGLFAYYDAPTNVLYLLLTGNIETNWNKLNVFIDAAPGGQNRLRGDNVDVAFGGLNRMGDDGSGNGLTFDPGFEPDLWINVNNGNTPVENWADSARLRTNGPLRGVVNLEILDYGCFNGGDKAQHDPIDYDGSSLPAPGIDCQDGFATSIFSSFAPQTSTDTLQEAFNTGAISLGNCTGWAAFVPTFIEPGRIRVAIDNSNIAGVTGSSAAGAADVKTGVELAIDLREAGAEAASEVRVTAFIAGTDFGFVSNQIVGGLPTPDNLGEVRDIDLGAIAGDQFVTIPLGGCYADCDGSGTLDLFDFLCFTNLFNAGDPYADCDGSGSLDLFDFLCFTNAFNAGCP